MRVLGLIPARGGSKGVPRKNIKLLCGKPLIEYTVRAALDAKYLVRVILSTEDEEIAFVARKVGADVPFMRPVDLAQDGTPTLPVVIHAIKALEDQGEYYDAVCLLQATNPLRTSEDIDACITLLKSSQASSVVTVLPVPFEHNPHWVYFQNQEGYLRLSTGEKEPISGRQQLPSAFHREGSVYVTRRDIIMEQKSLYGDKLLGFPMPVERSLNIDTLDDWVQAETRLCPSSIKSSG